jgi:hypothetical protein
MGGGIGASWVDRWNLSAFLYLPDDIQQDESPDNRGNQQAENASARNVEQAEYPHTDEGTYHPDNQITGQAEPSALHYFPGDEPGNDSDNEEQKQILCAVIHMTSSSLC